MAMLPGSGVAGGSVSQQEYEVGPDQLLVVYWPEDMGTELDAAAIFGAIAADAARRDADGYRIRTMTSMPLRHAGTWPGREGSGYETKVAVALIYERRASTPG
jgi:hypothetical protein